MDPEIHRKNVLDAPRTIRALIEFCEIVGHHYTTLNLMKTIINTYPLKQYTPTQPPNDMLVGLAWVLDTTINELLKMNDKNLKTTYENRKIVLRVNNFKQLVEKSLEIAIRKAKAIQNKFGRKKSKKYRRRRSQKQKKYKKYKKRRSLF